MQPLSSADAAIAQLVEQRIRNAWVRGSNPLCGTKKIVKSNTYVAPDSRAASLCPILYPPQCVDRGSNPLCDPQKTPLRIDGCCRTLSDDGWPALRSCICCYEDLGFGNSFSLSAI